MASLEKFFKAMSRLADDKPTIILVFLLIIFFIQGFTSSFRNSVTVDEFAHLPAGLFYWKTGNFKVYSHNPPLIKLAAAIPLLFSPAELPEKFIGRWGLGQGFMSANYEIYHLLFITGRTVILLISIFLAWLMFRFSKEMFGTKAALFSVFLFAFSPNILAHSYLVTTDLGACLAIFAALYTLWRYLENNSAENLFICALVFGLAQLTKFASLILIPAFPILMIFYYFFGTGKIHIRKIISATGVIYLTGVIIINAGYGFKGSFKPIGDHSFRSTSFLRLKSLAPESFPLPFPEAYLLGLDTQKYESDSSPGRTYLLGKTHTESLWYYYPLAFFVKTPIPVLILFFWAVLSGIFQFWKQKKDFFIVFICIFMLLYFIIFSSSVMNIGIRYLLPLYPLIFLLSGSLLKKTKLKGKLVLCILSFWLIVRTLLIYPHHLSYFNEFAGGPSSGHKVLADSNIDWGQDLISLKQYMLKNKLDFIYLSHFGLVEPSLYNIKYKPLPDHPVQGTVAISLNHYLGISPWKKIGDSYKWLREFEISDRVGYSILIFNLK